MYIIILHRRTRACAVPSSALFSLSLQEGCSKLVAMLCSWLAIAISNLSTTST